MEPTTRAQHTPNATPANMKRCPYCREWTMPEDGQINTQMPRDLVEEQIATIARLTATNAALLAALEHSVSMLRWSLHDKMIVAEHGAITRTIEMAEAAIRQAHGDA